ncbi:recombinase family protein [Streptomyces sp. NPDC056656]|uniref:recombinase family protein n=1 Tax=Streptomyces sp. NPDC056656 TaxID=3345895 RepID=UPI00367D4176
MPAPTSVDDGRRPPVPVVRAALMLRVSTRAQATAYGLDAQEEAGRAYVSNRPGWTLPPDLIFRDEGVPGTVVDRPGMRELEEAARRGRVDAIVVHNFDRIGRTGEAFWTWIWAMEDLGVDFVSVTQDIDTSTPLGRQQLQFHAMTAEAEWNLVRDRTQAGRQQKALAGGWPCGPAPWGYAIEGRDRRRSVLVVDDGEVSVVLKAVSLIADEGRSVSAAAGELNHLGLLPRSGRPWTVANLHRRLTSPSLLKGEVVFRNPVGTGTNRTKLDADGLPLHGDSVTISVPRIISADRAKALSDAMAKNGHRVHAAAGVYPLSGRIVGRCGHHYVGAYRNSDDTRYYRCGGGNNGKGRRTGCRDPYLSALDVEESVRAEIVTFLADSEHVEKAATALIKPSPGDIGKQRERVAGFESALQEKEWAVAHAAADLARRPCLDPTVLEAAMRQLKEDVVALLNVRVRPLGEVRKRSGVKCKVTDWHDRTGILVPDEVLVARWPAVEELMRSFFPRPQFARGAVCVRT